MRTGKPKKVKWAEYLAPHFKPPIKESADDDIPGTCGTHALQAITGLSLKYIAKQMRGRSGFWTDRSLLEFLRKRGYHIEPITLGSTCSYKGYGEKKKVTPMHVILASQHAYPTEGTWVVLHRNIEYHSGEIVEYSSTDFFNYPIWTAYVVFHKKWAPRDFMETQACQVWEQYHRLYQKANRETADGWKSMLNHIRRKHFGVPINLKVSKSVKKAMRSKLRRKEPRAKTPR